MSCCSHCGKKRAALKRCSRCKQASYCGAECQNAAWKGHKRTCGTLDEVWLKVNAARQANDWRELLKWEWRMEEMLQNQTDAARDSILSEIAGAHKSGMMSTGNPEYAVSIVSLQERRVELLGKMQRFRDQGETLCNIAEQLGFVGKLQESTKSFERARRVAEAHGFFSVECRSCLGLGKSAMLEGRADEGVEMLRHAMTAAPLSEENENNMELNVFPAFTNALFLTHAIDEVEPLVPRYLEAAKALSAKKGCLGYYDLHSLYTSARLHEARGRPQEAQGEVRALLALIRENEATVQNMLERVHDLLREAILRLKVLDPETGEKELVKSVAAELARRV